MSKRDVAREIIPPENTLFEEVAHFLRDDAVYLRHSRTPIFSLSKIYRLVNISGTCGSGFKRAHNQEYTYDLSMHILMLESTSVKLPSRLEGYLREALPA